MPLRYDPATDFPGLRAAGQAAARVLAQIVAELRPGLTTAAIDARIAELIAAQGAVPSLKGYRGFPAASCLSVDHVVANGVPGPLALTRRSLIGINVALCLDGWHVATNRGVALDGAPERARRLIAAAQACLAAAISIIRPGLPLAAIGEAIAATAHQHGFTALDGYGGHGIGRAPHEGETVPNHADGGPEFLLEAGMVLAPMPMLLVGHPALKRKPDGWTLFTADRSLSADAKDTVGVTEHGCEVFTAG